MNKKEILKKTKQFVEQEMVRGDPGHDLSHVNRVVIMAKKIARREKANIFIVELSALFHDFCDSKFADEKKGLEKINAFLISLEIEKKFIEEILYILTHMSFKNTQPENKSLEFKVVQDADRLDSIGAIGIARVFSYGGYKNRVIHDAKQKPNFNLTKEEYVKVNGTSINHFYEKLLLLKDLMNTETAKKIAEKRHKFMERYLKQFYKEWEGKL